MTFFIFGVFFADLLPLDFEIQEILLAQSNAKSFHARDIKYPVPLKLCWRNQFIIVLGLNRYLSEPIQAGTILKGCHHNLTRFLNKFGLSKTFPLPLSIVASPIYLALIGFEGVHDGHLHNRQINNLILEGVIDIIVWVKNACRCCHFFSFLLSTNSLSMLLNENFFIWEFYISASWALGNAKIYQHFYGFLSEFVQIHKKIIDLDLRVKLLHFLWDSSLILISITNHNYFLDN